MIAVEVMLGSRRDDAEVFHRLVQTRRARVARVHSTAPDPTSSSSPSVSTAMPSTSRWRTEGPGPSDFIGAPEAEECGLIHRAVATDELDQAVADLAGRLSAGPPIAMSLSKRLLNDAFGSTLEGALEDEARSQAINLTSSEFCEALEAFRQRRDADFRDV